MGFDFGDLGKALFCGPKGRYLIHFKQNSLSVQSLGTIWHSTSGLGSCPGIRTDQNIRSPENSYVGQAGPMISLTPHLDMMGALNLAGKAMLTNHNSGSSHEIGMSVSSSTMIGSCGSAELPEKSLHNPKALE